MTKKNFNLDSHNKRNSLGMTKQVYKSLLKNLNTPQTQSSDASIKRTFTRLEYLDPYLELNIAKTKNTRCRKITVASRNISRGGMSVLHSSFIYPGTVVSVSLLKSDGERQTVTGVVRRYTHRGGIVHEIGIQFDEEIIVHKFITLDINDSITSFETVDPKSLEGKILFVGSDPLIMPFVREFILDTNLNTSFTETANDASEKKLSEYDLIFVTLDVGDMSGPEFIRVLRNKNYTKPIILSGKMDNDQIKQHIRLSSADMFLPVPITQTSLLCALGEFLLTQWSENLLASVRSTVDTETANAFHADLANLATTLDEQLKAEDSVEVYITCTKIRNIAIHLGLKSLHTLTFTVCEEIAQTGDINKFQAELTSINKICKSANKAA